MKREELLTTIKFLLDNWPNKNRITDIQNDQSLSCILSKDITRSSLKARPKGKWILHGSPLIYRDSAKCIFLESTSLSVSTGFEIKAEFNLEQEQWLLTSLEEMCPFCIGTGMLDHVNSMCEICFGTGWGVHMD